MSSGLEKGRAAYQVEAAELLEELESSLLELEHTPEDQDLINRVFRAMHTIKGSGGMFGYTAIEQFTHEIENVYNAVRDGKIKIDRKLIDLTLEAGDHIRQLLKDDENTSQSASDSREALTRQFLGFLPNSDHGVTELSGQDKNKGEIPASGKDVSFYSIYFAPKAEIFHTGTNPIFLLQELCEMGRCEVIANTSRIPDLDTIEPERNYLSWQIWLYTGQDVNAIRDVFIFVEDDCEISIEKSPSIIPDDIKKRFPELEISKPETPQQEKTAPVKEHEEPQSKTDKSAPAPSGSMSSIRVASDKLDHLVNLVGELVIAQARLNQISQARHDTEITFLAEEMERLTNDLRDVSMNMRMVPLGALFQKFNRLVRDLARSQNKEVDFIVEGGETELDKNMIEKLNDPLIHLIRNAIDHGIEADAMRMIARKPKKGALRISASHSGTNVLIRVQDDGAGLDPDKIRKHAIERQLISPEAQLSEKEIYRLIFMPGFSTKNEITSVSGRGVGMDVVLRNIQSLSGTVDVESVKGKGTTVTLRLPLTLGIIEGLLVKVEQDHYVLPLSSVEECVELVNHNGHSKNQSRLIDIRGHAVPYVRLRDQFNLSGEIPNIEQILVMQINGERIGFTVDEIIGEQQVVIKRLGKMYRDIRGLSGATILGDGTVALILDTQQLMELAE